MSVIFALLIAATIILTSNLALADWKASFQQNPQIATQSASPSGTATIMTFNKIGSGSSSSSIYHPQLLMSTSLVIISILFNKIYWNITRQ